MDELRTLDNVTITVISGTSSVLYTIASGKEAYITHAMFSELSGVDSKVQLKDPRGSGLTVILPVEANTVATWQLCCTACGPITSGITVESPEFGGMITLLVQVDPKFVE